MNAQRDGYLVRADHAVVELRSRRLLDGHETLGLAESLLRAGARRVMRDAVGAGDEAEIESTTTS